MYFLKNIGSSVLYIPKQDYSVELGNHSEASDYRRWEDEQGQEVTQPCNPHNKAREEFHYHKILLKFIIFQTFQIWMSNFRKSFFYLPVQVFYLNLPEDSDQ